MIIVSDRIYVQPGKGDEFLALSLRSIEQARHTAGCRDFVVAPDPIEADRVKVYEEWTSRDALTAFRGGGPSEEFSSLIVRSEVTEHTIAS